MLQTKEAEITSAIEKLDEQRQYLRLEMQKLRKEYLEKETDLIALNIKHDALREALRKAEYSR